MQALVGSPAMAQQQDTSCAPFPERPGAGMVGAIDPPQGNGLRGGKDSGVPYTDEKYPNSPYRDHGYAGMTWHVYDPNCKQPLSISDPSVTIDTWAGNELFNIGKNIVGATNSLHYTLYNGGVLGGLNQQIGAAADSIFDNIYMQLFSIFMLILAILMFRQIWKGDLASVSKRGLFALGGMWLAASTPGHRQQLRRDRQADRRHDHRYPERLRGSQPRRRPAARTTERAPYPRGVRELAAWRVRQPDDPKADPVRSGSPGRTGMDTRRPGLRQRRERPGGGREARRVPEDLQRPRLGTGLLRRHRGEPHRVRFPRRSSSRWSTRCSSSSPSWPCCWHSCCCGSSRSPRR